MKRTLRLGMALLVLAGLLTTVAAAQSLGEYARQQRAKKPATPAGAAGAKVYTNDNLPTSGGLSEVGRLEPPPPPPLSPQAAAAEQRAVQKKAEEQKSLETEWRAKVTEQKKIVERLERELDISVRESKLRQIANRSDTAAQLSRPGQLAETERKDQADVAEKQQALDAAKQKLESMKEELRQAGLPAAWAE